MGCELEQAATKVEEGAEPLAKQAHETVSSASNQAKEAAQSGAHQADDAIHKGSQNVAAKAKELSGTAKHTVICLAYRLASTLAGRAVPLIPDVGVPCLWAIAS